MSTIKVACPKCGQKVSGDETFYGTSVECPICTSQIQFPVAPSSLNQGQAAPEPGPVASPEAPSREEYSPLPPVPPKDDVGPEIPEDRYRDQRSRDRSREDDYRDDRSSDRRRRRDQDWDDDDYVPSPAFGIISLVSAILGVISCGTLAIIAAPAAIIFGHLGLSRAKQSSVQPGPGFSQSMIGVIIGYVLLFAVIVGLIVLAFFGEPIKAVIEQSKNAPPQIQGSFPGQ